MSVPLSEAIRMHKPSILAHTVPAEKENWSTASRISAGFPVLRSFRRS